jgi:hypothetical protein
VDQKLAPAEISFLVKNQHASQPPGCVRDPIDDIVHQAKFCAPPGCSRAGICSASQFVLNPYDARESASLTRVKHLQLGNPIVGATEPPTKLAVDILHHHHIRVDVGLVARVEFLGRELVQHGWALRDDGG